MTEATISDAASDSAPAPTCERCPRLKAFRSVNRLKFPQWHNAPVPSFGPIGARLLIVGLAPGLKGANATGRPFTGDYAGALLYPTLLKFGFAEGDYGAQKDDGLRLLDTRISNAVRCVPPQNRPTAAEVRTCGTFLRREIDAMNKLVCILTLGSISHGSVLKALGMRLARAPFAHGAVAEARPGLSVIASYHCSRLNTNTGRLTAAMFEAVLQTVRLRLDREN